jgi:signal transduction histidine kinase/CheY-like chemotaxis protein
VTTHSAAAAAIAPDGGLSGYYRTLFDSMDEGFCVIEFFDGPHGPLSDYIHIEANPAYARHAGIPNVVGQKVREMVGAEADGWVELYRGVLVTGEPIRFERELVATKRHLALSAFRIEPASRKQVAVLFQDITARKNAERELRELNETLEARIASALAEQRETEAALRQAQKMEAVGQLTGGLAHDFNNLLAGIAGSFEMIGLRLAQGRSADVEKYLAAGQGAVRRAAALTHRLLAFSRRQTLSPKPTVINRLLNDFVELVRRTVGPAIEVETVAGVGLWPSLVDSNQLENALLNLCINARDAMPDGGKLTIETGNKWLDQRAARERGMEAGQYITVCVSDTGTGIDKETLPRVFDPFFTTKPMGQGTGLGLSMVYGFARQSNGHVRIYSEVGQGTMVCIYLPRHVGEESADEQDNVPEHAQAEGGATVLVIDDEPTMRMLISDALGDLGYRCVEAADGAAGLKILQGKDKIDLLITDVGLPGGLNGRQVADAARALRTDLKVLFITGYAENAALNHGHIERGMEVLTKPFAVDELAGRVERILSEGKSGA